MADGLLSILIPAYNNEAYLRELCARIDSSLAAKGIAFEIVFVNDGSHDRTWAILSELAASDQRIKAICLSRNFGQHAAISAALEHASGDRFVLMDADLQDRPELIPTLLEKLGESPNDIVYTLKTGGEEGFVRRLTSRAFHSFVSSSTASHTETNIGTFRAFNKRVAEALLDYRERAVVYGPLMHTMGYRTAFVPVPRDARQGSGSSYTFSKRMSLAFQSIVSYSTLPQKLLLWTGGIVCASSVLYLLAIVVQYLAGGESLTQGLTLLVVLVLFLIGVLMLGLGIISAYLFLVYREILDRPRYHVQQAINVKDRP